MNTEYPPTRNRAFPRASGLLVTGLLAVGFFLLTATSVMAADDVPKSTIVRTTPGGLSPVPVITSVSNQGANLHLEWFGITPPYTVETKGALGEGDWSPSGPANMSNQGTVPNDGTAGFFRINATAPNYVGAETCNSCHTNSHALWGSTKHAIALDSLKAIGQGENSFCLPCHTVGYGLPNGFIDETITPQLAGVQCENCHGPGGNHASSPFNEMFKPKIELSSMVCGGCHTGAHHPTYDEWELSGHAHALATIQNRSFKLDRCLECHSHDYRYALENELNPPTVDTAQLSLECSTCHSAHDEEVEVAQLRKPIAMLCGECHTAGDSVLGNNPHHPQFQVLSGYGTFDENGMILTNTTSTHVNLATSGGGACAQCHVVHVSRESPNSGNPNVTGHTFNPFDTSLPTHSPDDQYAGCRDCHSDMFSDILRNNLQANVSGFLDYLAPFFDSSNPSYIDPATLSMADSNRLEVATWNYKYLHEDKSLGLHNPNLYRESLNIASNIVNDLSGAMSLQAVARQE